MASLKSRARKFPVPDEPGEWMAFRRLSERELQDRTDLSLDAYSALTLPDRFELALRWIAATLTAWSYDEPCTIDVVRDHLDRPTLTWAFTTAFSHTLGQEPLEEKKADSPRSTATSTESPAPAAPATGS